MSIERRTLSSRHLISEEASSVWHGQTDMLRKVFDQLTHELDQFIKGTETHLDLTTFTFTIRRDDQFPRTLNADLRVESEVRYDDTAQVLAIVARALHEQEKSDGKR